MQHTIRNEVPPEIVVPVTPFLDMTIQLMFFFLATFNPSSVKEGQMDMSLPARNEPVTQTPDDQTLPGAAHKEEVDVPTDLTISLRGYRDVRNKGQVSALIVTTSAGDEELRGGRDDREKLLLEKLIGARPTFIAGESRVPTIRMTAESDVRWEQVMRIMDLCYKTGFQVSYVRPGDLGSSSP